MQNFIVSPLQCPIDHSSFLQSGFEGHHLKFLSFDPQLKLWKITQFEKILPKFWDISHYTFLQNYQESDYFDKKTVKGTKPKTANRIVWIRFPKNMWHVEEPNK